MVSACTQPEGLVETEVFDIKVIDSPFDFMSQIESIELVAFPESPLIGKIKKVFMDEKRVYVVDGATDDVKIYDHEFKYLKTISSKGQGPGMYHSIFNAFVENEKLHIFSHFDLSIFEYNLDGEFIKKRRLDDRPYQMIKLDNGFLGYQNFNSDDLDKYNLTLWSGEGKEIANSMPYNENLSNLIGYSGGMTSIAQDNSHFYYQNPLSDTLVYMNSDLKVEKLYRLNMVENPYEGAIQDFGVEKSMRHGYISKFESPAQGRMFVWYKGVEPPAVVAGMADLEQRVFHKFENFQPRGLHYFVADVQFVDNSGYVYALPRFDFVTTIVSQFPESLSELPDPIKTPILENAENEDFKYLIKFKFKE